MCTYLEGLRIALITLMKLFLLFVSLTQIKWRWKHCKNVLNCLNVKLKAILDMRLRRLTGLERDKIENSIMNY